MTSTTITMPSACSSCPRATRRVKIASCMLLIDLGLLQLTAVVCVDHLPFGEDIQARQAGLAVAVAGSARAAEGELDLRARCAGVDVENAGSDITRGPLDAIDVLRVDCAGEAKGSIVVDCDGLFKRFYLDHGEDGTKDLFPGQAHSWRDISEERGTIEVAPGQLAFVDDGA